MLSAIVNKGLRANFGLFAEMGATPLNLKSLDGSSEFTSAHFGAHVEKIRAGAVQRDSKVYQMTKDGFCIS